ncbi:MAG: carboxypeptidase-like regulatory domain-containing protein [Bacteroidales bacterium]|nr:carboxypeptidase-like regulatory domain-containing protein [Bacteroidales bacterium]
MKKLTLFLLFFGMVFIHQAIAQERQIIQGYCKDENGKAIENVSVYVHDSLLVSVTDEQGRFTYSLAKTGLKLRFAHMVFEPTYYTIKEKDINGKNLTVRMKTKSHELLEVEITANAPHIAFDNPVMTVIDYTIREDGIYLIAYRRRNSALLHLSFDGDTLHELPISSRYKYLNKDAFGDIYALNDYQASLVGFMELDNGKKMMMNFYHSMSRKAFYDKFSGIVAAIDSVYITGRYFYYNKEMGYYRHRLGSDEEPELLHYIVDEEGRDDIWLLTHTRGGIGANFWVADPIYNPIYAIDNKFYLFAYTDHETIVFDAEGNELERYPLTFHEYRKWNGKMEPDRRWKQKMMMDAARKEFYTFFVTDGIYTLKRIDLKTGTITSVMDLSGYPFAQNMRIHDGVLYFIYPTGINKRKALYQVKIE